MKNEKPILFSSSMVKAILSGRKTQTRRVIQPQPERCLVDCDERGWYYQVPIEEETPIGKLTFMDRAGYTTCPYGSVGTCLWVRETWQAFLPNSWKPISKVNPQPNISVVCFKATESDRAKEYGNAEYCGVWRPSIFMPRWASRITLEITGIRVERLQDISNDDINAEGLGCRKCKGRGWYLENFADNHPTPCSDCKKNAEKHGHNIHSGQFARQNLQNTFAVGWDSINGKRKGCTWQDNPWVWVIEFKRLEASQ